MPVKLNTGMPEPFILIDTTQSVIYYSPDLQGIKPKNLNFFNFLSFLGFHIGLKIIVIVNLKLLHVFKSEKCIFGIICVCEYSNTKTHQTIEMKFGIWSLPQNCRFVPNLSTGSIHKVL